jgi:hypothetical protein
MNKTKYYRALYTNKEGSNEVDVFVGPDIKTATTYAQNENSLGRHLVSVDEYDTLDEAWNIN